MSSEAAQGAIELLAEVTCPNCWHRFPPESSLYIAGHSTLTGDPRLEDRREKRRFMPTRFTPDGAALDIMGTACRDLACPNCHLLVPRVLLERRSTVFLSIFGRPSSGKSYFLAAMMRQMKRTLPRLFALGVTEPHPPSNRLAQAYENSLFNHPNVEAFSDIPKTQEAGDQWYQQVKFGDELRQYPRPMFFQIAPLAGHPNGDNAARYARTLCLYDNAGESFEPGKDTPNNPVTQHMARSSGLFFIFDPTQEPLFLRQCSGRTTDPQVEENMRDRGQDSVTDPQHVVLSTASQNVKKYLGREIARQLDVPLMVIVSKFDAWRHLLGGDLPDFHVTPKPQGAGQPVVSGLRISVLEEVSGRIKDLMRELAPEVLSATEQFSRHVYFVPSSATGCAPRVVGRDERSGKPTYKFRVGDLSPHWAEVPLLWMMSRHVAGLVPTSGARSQRA
jgi:hypothetical protein